jgi:6,7-dimethyl-8-ribityllumazine synthase
MGKLAPVIFGLLTADVKSAVKRTRTLAVFLAVAAVFGLAAFAAIVAAGSIALAHVMRPEFAALAMAMILLAISLAVLAAASIWSARERRRQAAGNAARTIAAAAAVSFLPMLASNRAGLGLLAVFAGYAIARRKPPLV